MPAPLPACLAVVVGTFASIKMLTPVPREEVDLDLGVGVEWRRLTPTVGATLAGVRLGNRTSIMGTKNEGTTSVGVQLGNRTSARGAKNEATTSTEVRLGNCIDARGVKNEGATSVRV